jgi:site-specific recombinase XerD
MENNQMTFEELTKGAVKCLQERLGRSSSTQQHYVVLWNRIKKHMVSREILFLDTSVCEDFLKSEYFNKDFSELTKRDRDMVKAVEILMEYINAGTLVPKKELMVFAGSIGELMTRYLTYKSTFRLANHTLDEYKQQLFRFLVFLNEENIMNIKAVNVLHFLLYLKKINPRFASLPHMAIRILRDFFKYLYNQGFLDLDVSSSIPKDNYKKQPKLPSTYAKEEVEVLINHIDRASKAGKRNYAIVLLAARLGLRASDIANLKFEDIHWEMDTIQIYQYKTGKKLELPLLPEIGNAIIEYLKYGRPVSSSHHVFLVANSPFNPISGSLVGTLVQKIFAASGINIHNRKHGPHALRHSLAGFLLENRVQLPVISEVLGHKTSESTRFYLRIDINSLKNCMLDVPVVDPSFYSQEGGFFYE